MSVYWGGELFDAKHLLGNQMLANALHECSGLTVHLPQDKEAIFRRGVDIRDADILAVQRSAACVFNFDGPELDSGTVVEFMVAKQLDIPCVLLRTDFRGGGDQAEGDPFNLMLSFYPRTRVVLINALEEYRGVGGDANLMCSAIAARVHAALEEVMGEAPRLTGETREHVMRWAARFHKKDDEE